MILILLKLKMIESNFKFGEQVDQDNYLHGFTYTIEFDKFKWDFNLVADYLKKMLLLTPCSVEGWTGKPFKINEEEKEVYWENHWKNSYKSKKNI